MSTINDDDKFLVNRNNNSYQVEAQNLMADLQDTDLMLVNRGGTSYKITGADAKNSLNPKAAPVIESVLISEEDNTGDRFTNQDFNVSIALSNTGNPTATFALSAEVIAQLANPAQTSAITSSVNQSGDEWTQKTSSFDARAWFLSAKPDGSQILAIGDYNKDFYYESSDYGETWTQRQWDGSGIDRGSDKNLRTPQNVVWAQNRWNAVPYHWDITDGNKRATSMSSVDGINWQYEGHLPDTTGWGQNGLKQLGNLTYGNGVFACAATGCTGIIYSYDLSEWFCAREGKWKTEAGGNRNGYNYFTSMYGKGLYALGIGQPSDEAVSPIIVSSNGQYYNWPRKPEGGRQIDASYLSMNLKGGGFGSGKFIFTSESTTNNYNIVMSEDGYNWSFFTGPYNNMATTAFGGGKFASIDRDTNNPDFCAYSFDGITWEVGVDYLNESNISAFDIVYANGGYIGASPQKGFIKSTNLDKGGQQLVTVSSDQDLLEIGQLSGNVFSVSGEGTLSNVNTANKTVLVSNATGSFNNGEVLTGPRKKIVSSNVTNVVLKQSNPAIISNGSGGTWALEPDDGEYSNGKWVIVQNNSNSTGHNKILYSTNDGASWQNIADNSTHNSLFGNSSIYWYDIAAGTNGTFMTVCGQYAPVSCIAKSDDGINWRANNGDCDWLSPGEKPKIRMRGVDTDGNGTWVASSEEGFNEVSGRSDAPKLIVSLDNGENWKECILPTEVADMGFFGRVRYGGGVWIAQLNASQNYINGLQALYSTDGLNWFFTRGFPIATNYLLDYGNGKWFGFWYKHIGTSVLNYKVGSEDGINWYSLKNGICENYNVPARQCKFASNKWVIVHQTYDHTLISYDGETTVTDLVADVTYPAQWDRAWSNDPARCFDEVSYRGIATSRKDPSQSKVIFIGGSKAASAVDGGTPWNLNKADNGTRGDRVTLTFANSDELIALRAGDRVYQESGAAGIFVSADLDNSTAVVEMVRGTWATGEPMKAEERESIETVNLYCVLDNNTNVTDLSTSNPGFTAISSPSVQIKFPPILPDGQAPDGTLLVGSGIQATARAINEVATSEKDSNLLIPTSDGSTGFAFNASDPQDVADYAALAHKLECYEECRDQRRAALKAAMIAANFTSDDIATAGLADA